MKHLAIFRKQFDEAIYFYLKSKLKDYTRVDPHGGDMAKCIMEFMEYGGKRLRPGLFYSSYQSYSMEKKIDPLKFSFIFELFHTFALIHDDIIDHAELRRGNQTVHVKHGLEMGILAGDFALTLADELFMDIIFTSPISESIKKQSITLYNKYKQELLIGQYLDSKHLGSPEKIMLLKTAQYSFARPVEFGLLLADVPQKVIRKWETWMTKAGMAFQLRDDFEGIMGDEIKEGKSVVSDTEEGKNTFIVRLFKEKANKQEQERFYSFFGKQSIINKDINWYKNKIKEKQIDIEIKSQINNSCKELYQELLTTLGGQTGLHNLAQEILEYIQMI
ncbi:MAG: polyprenyl synthetase family protein [Patescibacteria group bacterium]